MPLFWDRARARDNASAAILDSLVGIRTSLEHLHQASSDVVAPAQPAVDEALEARIRNLEDLVERLPQRWEDIRHEVERRENRARHHVRRVREKLEEHGLEDAAIEDLADELGIEDGSGSSAEGVRLVPPDMEIGPVVDDSRARLLAMKYGA